MSIEVKELLRLLKSDPRARRSVRAALILRRVSERLAYPISNWNDLMRKMSAESPLLSDLKVVPNSLSKLVPKSYFPITSKEDLIKKAQELYVPYLAASPTLPLPPPHVEARFVRRTKAGSTLQPQTARESASSHTLKSGGA